MGNPDRGKRPLCTPVIFAPPGKVILRIRGKDYIGPTPVAVQKMATDEIDAGMRLVGTIFDDRGKIRVKQVVIER